ncbi:MAG: hypothetical protein ABIR54_11720 [Burkholderiaceae bacterium]|jgi:hypothetical protein
MAATVVAPAVQARKSKSIVDLAVEAYRYSNSYTVPAPPAA